MKRAQDLQIERSPNNPLITFDSHPSLGTNINGPSVMRVPDWVPEPLGTYYLYFAHHQGTYIRLAVADDLEGPWTLYEPGVLPLEDSAVSRQHLASPDLHVDEENQEILMYFHSPVHDKEGQFTFLARSRDGLHFAPEQEELGISYFRVFSWDGWIYGISRAGRFYRSRQAGANWEERSSPLVPDVVVKDASGERERILRHSAVWLEDSTLYLFYSRIGDCPERLVVSTVSLEGDWDTWSPSEPVEILQPEEPFEGMAYPMVPSRTGKGIEKQELRDPGVFEEDGVLYLYYSYAGEMGLALAKIQLPLRL